MTCCKQRPPRLHPARPMALTCHGEAPQDSPSAWHFAAPGMERVTAWTDYLTLDVTRTRKVRRLPVLTVRPGKSGTFGISETSSHAPSTDNTDTSHLWILS